MTAQEVLLDMVVRDKKGRPVLDITQNEVDVFEDGARQSITGFRLVDRGTLKLADTGPTTPDPLHNINLVTLVFDRTGNDPEPRRLSREAALQFLSVSRSRNTYIAVFAVDYRLQAIQPFTNDSQQLRDAVELATLGKTNEYTAKAEQVRTALEQLSRARSDAEAAVASAGRANSGAGVGEAVVEAEMAQMAANILTFAESMEREFQSSNQLTSLIALVREQQKLLGRKTIIYFSNGLAVTPERIDLFRNAIGIANRSQVSFYTVDITGLDSSDKMQASRQALQTATAASAAQTQRTGGAVSVTEVRVGEIAESSVNANTQETLATLARETGGLEISNSNDLRPFMNQVSDDIRYYYEIAYSLQSPKYDGRFRHLSVKVNRQKVTVQARSGYYALPPSFDGPVMLAHEIPLLGLLSADKPPHDFEHHAQVLRFNWENGRVHLALVVEFPNSALSLLPDARSGKFQADLALMALVKDESGQIVKKISRKYPVQVERENVEGRKGGTTDFADHFWLAPGRYTLESIVLNVKSGTASTRRSLLYVPQARSGIAMSSLSVLKRIDPNPADSREMGSPLVMGSSRLIPNLAEPFSLAQGSALSFYFVAYPDRQLTEGTSLRMQFLQNGLVVKEASIKLPRTDGYGRIPYLAKIPADQFKPGDYEVRAIVEQGNRSVEEHAFFTIVE
ncbi:MAG TPA: VWA domain-containing protein [Acidobacteriota bacterium]|nr:VWA domain-containing protein [Acidobacteriota bacterium]